MKKKRTAKIEVELGKYQFQCKKCKKVHTRSSWSIAHYNVAQVFTCECGNEIKIKAEKC